MNVSDLTPRDLRKQLRGPGLFLRTGPFVARINTSIDAVTEGIRQLYADYPTAPEDGFADFHVALYRPRNLRRWYHPQVVFAFDGWVPFKPLPLSQAFPMLEWGLNWCVANHMHRYLILHAAVIERDGYAAVLPGEPGAGKSTLCAGLVARGWRLLSDELTLISPENGRVVPVPRPVSLKEGSIEVIRTFAPDAVIGRAHEDTRKGTVAHMQAPTQSVEQALVRAVPAWIIAPRYEGGAAPRLERESPARMFMHLAQNAFNYHLHGAEGFELLGRLIDQSHTFRFSYSRLEDAVQVFARLPLPASDSESQVHAHGSGR